LFLKKYFIDPCEGDCLVKSTCRLKSKYVWTRSEQCPEYEKWRKLDRRIKEVKEWAATLFWGSIVLTIIIWFIFTFFWGIYQEYLYIKGLF